MKKLILAAALVAAGSGIAVADEYTAILTELANTRIAEITQNDLLISAIVAQNGMTSGYDQATIDGLDQQWRAEVDAADKPLINDVLGNDLSAWLMQVQEESQGLFTEIFAMDGVGLNVGQSGVTSDYWQGDEGKWQNTYGVGAGSVDVSEVELDESTQTFQSQVSVPVVDGSGNVIGAVTFGVNVEML